MALTRFLKYVEQLPNFAIMIADDACFDFLQSGLSQPALIFSFLRTRPAVNLKHHVMFQFWIKATGQSSKTITIAATKELLIVKVVEWTSRSYPKQQMTIALVVTTIVGPSTIAGLAIKASIATSISIPSIFCTLNFCVLRAAPTYRRQL